MIKCFCPVCGESSRLATIENTIAEWKYFDGLDEFGDVKWNGDSDYGDSDIVGVACAACDWEYRGEDWMTKLATEDPM